MQKDLDAAHPAVKVKLLGVNGAGLESANDLMVAGRALPWLQDTGGKDVWGSWAVAYRDVVVLAADDTRIISYNLTVHDLGDTTNYQALKKILLDAAR